MSFADDVDAALKPTVRCRTCQVLAEMAPERRAEVQAYILANPARSRRISLALKKKDKVSVSESSIRNHLRDGHDVR